MLLSGLGSVRIGKNCNLGLENAALGLRPRAAFSRPRSQFFPIRTSQSANNVYQVVVTSLKIAIALATCSLNMYSDVLLYDRNIIGPTS